MLPIKYFCAYCGKICKQHRGLLKHQRTRHFKCQVQNHEYCRYPFDSLQALKQHYYKMHGPLKRIPHASKCCDQMDVTGMQGLKQEDIDRFLRWVKQRTKKTAKYVQQKQTPQE
ncbi:Conserved_hypothetical protein [Hexamita inflata]|uniref:C2H2-type domain-containing protein n=1 Tax=Hexamita inflata TaxID=28002 RepID=A0AA86PZR7_9EUKA|nr:Conserved hypothetical protein [Hexamita inflata]